MDAVLATALLSSALAAAVPLMLAGLGQLVAERSGMLNLGVEGTMLMGAATGYIAAARTGQPWLGLAASVLAGMAMAAVFAFLTLAMRANQVASGLALTLLGSGLSSYLGKDYASVPIAGTLAVWPVPGLSGLPIVGRALFTNTPIVYLALLMFAGVAWGLHRTRAGLVLRAVGESPRVADAIGLPVMATRLLAVLFGGAMTGLAGGYHAVVYLHLWQEQMTAGLGWIALGLVVFAAWRPWRLLGGALLFGAVMSLQFYAQGGGGGVPAPFLSMLPYAATIGVLVAISAGKRRTGVTPASLGKTFSRE